MILVYSFLVVLMLTDEVVKPTADLSCDFCLQRVTDWFDGHLARKI